MDRRRDIFAEYCEAERQVEADALEAHPKPKGKDVLLVDAIKADMARRSYIAKRMKEVKTQMVEYHQISLSELEDLVREGNARGWPKTKPKQ